MTAQAARNLWLLLFLLLPVTDLFACEIPPALLVGRSIPDSLRILEGEVIFQADARLHDFEGRSRTVSGLVMTRGLEDGVGCVTIDAKSLDTGIGLRNRIMWEDHLEVAKFPEIQFIHTGFVDPRPAEIGGVFLTLEGDLTIHGVTRKVKIPAWSIETERGIRVEGRVHLKMSEYRIERPALLFISVKDEVQVSFWILLGRG